MKTQAEIEHANELRQSEMDRAQGPIYRDEEHGVWIQRNPIRGWREVHIGTFHTKAGDIPNVLSVMSCWYASKAELGVHLANWAARAREQEQHVW
jgi:hypothetical protein